MKLSLRPPLLDLLDLLDVQLGQISFTRDCGIETCQNVPIFSFQNVFRARSSRKQFIIYVGTPFQVQFSFSLPSQSSY